MLFQCAQIFDVLKQNKLLQYYFSFWPARLSEKCVTKDGPPLPTPLATPLASFSPRVRAASLTLGLVIKDVTHGCFPTGTGIKKLSNGFQLSPMTQCQKISNSSTDPNTKKAGNKDMFTLLWERKTSCFQCFIIAVNKQEDLSCWLIDCQQQY